jgi:putative hydrolase of HD superfamily
MQQIIDFILELEKLKGVTRKTRPLGLDRYENSISLERFAESPVEINRVVRMLLVHDIGEIDTGDTIVFAEDGWADRKAAEQAAVKRIFGMLTEEQAADFLALWQEFDRAETAEARFAHAVDRAMPVLLNLANEGQSWRENGISYERVVHRIKSPIQAGCPELWNYLEVHLEEARKKGLFGA